MELADQTLNPNDLKLFFQKFAPKLAGTLPTLISIDGGEKSTPYPYDAATHIQTGVIDPTQTDPNLIGESNLDFQLIMGLLGETQEVKLYQVGGSTSTFACSESV